MCNVVDYAFAIFLLTLALAMLVLVVGMTHATWKDGSFRRDREGGE